MIADSTPISAPFSAPTTRHPLIGHRVGIGWDISLGYSMPNETTVHAITDGLILVDGPRGCRRWVPLSRIYTMEVLDGLAPSPVEFKGPGPGAG